MAGPVGSAVGVLSGVAVGGAATVALQPAFEIPRQDAWSRNPNKILDVGLLARLVAQGGVPLADAHSEALRDGFKPDKVDALVYLEQTVPGFAQALELWRRGFISDGLMSHALVKAGLDQRYAAALLQLKTAELVGIGDVAYGVVRGILPAPSWVPVAPPTSGTSVPRFPQVNIDPVTLAHELGFDEEMLKLMVGRSGLSLAPGLAATALFRKIINHEDFLLAIAEGDLRTEWADTLRDASRAIPSPDQYAELRLRGWIDQNAAEAGAARHGMSAADADQLYRLHGRPTSIRQVYIGLARGATYDGTPQDIPEPYLSAARQSNLRPEWFSVAYANRYSLPSAFVVRALLRDGAITADRASTIFQHEGWPQELADLVANHYAAPTTAGTDPHVAKAQTQLWTTTHSAYKNGEVDQAEVTRNLSTLGVPAAAQTQVLTLWNAERDTYRKQLTPTQLKKAWRGAAVNPATGAVWTKDEVLAALIARGYSPNDANTFLEL